MLCQRGIFWLCVVSLGNRLVFIDIFVTFYQRGLFWFRVVSLGIGKSYYFHWDICYFLKVVEKSSIYGFGHWDIVLFFANTFVMEKSSICDWEIYLFCTKSQITCTWISHEEAKAYVRFNSSPTQLCSPGLLDSGFVLVWYIVEGGMERHNN